MIGNQNSWLRAESIVDSRAVLGVFGAPVWGELGDDRKKWVVALIHEAQRPLLDVCVAILSVVPVDLDDSDDPEFAATYSLVRDAVAKANGGAA